MRRCICKEAQEFVAQGFPGKQVCPGSKRIVLLFDFLQVTVQLGIITPFQVQPQILNQDYIQKCKNNAQLCGTLVMISHKGAYLTDCEPSSYLKDDDTADANTEKWRFYALQVFYIYYIHRLMIFCICIKKDILLDQKHHI